MPRQFLFAACVLMSLAGALQAQSVSIRPEYLREGDGQTRNITVTANVAPSAQFSVWVSYSSDPGAASTTFISKLSIQDNSSGDRNPESGKIRLVLPKAFNQLGVYWIYVDEPSSAFKLVHEPDTRSFVRRFFDYLATAAGSGQRGGERKTARERIEEITKNKTQNTLAIWTAVLPQVGQRIDKASIQRKIESAVMPSWSSNGNLIACSAWRNGKWIITAYTIDQTGATSESWQWTSSTPGAVDFSPAWSPDNSAIAFVRLSENQKSDVWLLQLDKKGRPQKEVKVTETGNVEGVVGWDKDVGLLFETKNEVEGYSPARQLWATKTVLTKTTRVAPVALSDAYKTMRGGAPQRGTLIYAQENDGPPRSVLYEVDSSGKRSTLLLGDFCSHKWPTVSPDAKWLAFDYDCRD